jgi:hypothetical protein
MTMKRSLLRARPAAAFFGLIALLLPGSGRAQAPGDLAFTAFPNANVDSLAGGQVLQARGGLIDFQRGLTSQALYLINAPLATVQAKLTSWDPASHPELQVWMHNSLPARPTVADFGALQTLPSNSSVNNLINATAKFDPANPSLQVNRDEAQLLASMKASNPNPRTFFATAWSQILSGRVDRFLGAKLGGENYIVSGGDIQPLTEIKSLLRSDVKIYQRYHPLLVNTPVYASNKAAPVNLYYESFDVEGSAVLGTGAVYQSQPNGAPAAPAALPPGTSVLSADIEYYLNNGIYVSLELEQLSPVMVGGREETLVWRADLVSTSNIAYLHGTERLASGMIMLQDVKQAVDAFRSEFR